MGSSITLDIVLDHFYYVLSVIIFFIEMETSSAFPISFCEFGNAYCQDVECVDRFLLYSMHYQHSTMYYHAYFSLIMHRVHYLPATDLHTLASCTRGNQALELNQE